MYNRDGSPRGSWYDPLGFAGLDKVPPPPDVIPLLEASRSDVSNRQNLLRNLVEDTSSELRGLGTELKSMEGNPHLAKPHLQLQKKVAVLVDQVRGFRREQSENAAVLESLAGRLERERKGVLEGPLAHIHHLDMPAKTTRMRFDHAAEAWAAISLSLLLFGIVGLLLLAPRFLAAGLIVMMVLFMVTESVLRSAFIQTVSQLTALLAIIAAVILVIHFWFWILIGVLVTLAVFLLFQRLRELTG
jgi:hypothetical protein